MSTHYLGSTKRNEGEELGSPTKIYFDKKAGRLLCGFGGCRRPAKEMVTRLQLNLAGELRPKKVPWCGFC
jgi:hypothetical protein